MDAMHLNKDNPLVPGTKIGPYDLDAGVARRGVLNARPTIPNDGGLLIRMSQPFVNIALSEDYVDTTGRSPKIVFASQVEARLTSTEDVKPQPVQKTFSRPINLAVTIPLSTSLNVEFGAGIDYLSCAMFEAAFSQEGSWTDKRGQLTFYNSLVPTNGGRWTAAALTMAHLYVSNHLLPLLGRGLVGAPIPAVPYDDPRNAPDPRETVFMPHELASRHSAEALAIVYFACESHIVFQSAGEPPIKRVYSNVGAIAQTIFSIDNFWEAYHILALTACGSGSKDQWDMDFLLGIIQNFGLHGNCDEGGIYRNMWNSIPFEANRGIVCSNFNRQVLGYSNRSPMNVLGSSITIQTIVCRSLAESNLKDELFCEGPGITNVEAQQCMQTALDEIRINLARGTGLDLSYFETNYGRSPFSPNNLRDRHISMGVNNYFKHYATFMPSFVADLGVSYLDEYKKLEFSNPNFVKFTGTGRAKLDTLDHEVLFDLELNSRPHFKRALFWLRPGINKNDGISELEFYQYITSAQQNALSQVNLLDGTTMTTGDAIDQYCWRDNGDLIPSLCELRSNEFGIHHAKIRHLETIYHGYTYFVVVSKYSPIGSKYDRAGMSRWDRFVEVKYGPVYMPSGGESLSKRMSVSLRMYYRKVRKYAARELQNRVTRVERSTNREFEHMVGTLIPTEKYNKSSPEERSDLLHKSVALKVAKASYLKILKDKLRKILSVMGESPSIVNLLRACNKLVALKKVLNDMGFTTYFRFPSVKDYEEGVGSESTVKVDTKYGRTASVKKSAIILSYGLHKKAREFDRNTYIEELNAFINLVDIELSKQLLEADAARNSLKLEDVILAQEISLITLDVDSKTQQELQGIETCISDEMLDYVEEDEFVDFDVEDERLVGQPAQSLLNAPIFQMNIKNNPEKVARVSLTNLPKQSRWSVLKARDEEQKLDLLKQYALEEEEKDNFGLFDLDTAKKKNIESVRQTIMKINTSKELATAIQHLNIEEEESSPIVEGIQDSEIETENSVGSAESGSNSADPVNESGSAGDN